MKRLSRWVPELALGALALALAVLLVVPWRERRGPAETGEDAPVSPALAAQPASTGGKTVPPRQLAALFGWREAKPAPAARTAVLPAEEAAWIQAVGYVVEQNGAHRYIFKDTRAGGVFSLKTGDANQGWKLVEVRENDFLLELRGKPYIIKRKP